MDSDVEGCFIRGAFTGPYIGRVVRDSPTPRVMDGGCQRTPALRSGDRSGPLLRRLEVGEEGNAVRRADLRGL